jgi:hypothetical protein
MSLEGNFLYMQKQQQPKKLTAYTIGIMQSKSFAGLYIIGRKEDIIMKKKALALLLLIMTFALAACSQGDDAPEEETMCKFYTLQEAYEEGFLTGQDLIFIPEYYVGGVVFRDFCAQGIYIFIAS